jgi:hypothetical protein
MKTAQRSTTVRWACATILAMLATTAFAVDKGVYEGEWITQSPALALKITGQEAQFTIDGKTYTDPTPEYFYGQLATYPFLYLHTDETSSDPAYAQNEHRFYLIIGEDGKDAKGEVKLGLRGYYDFSRVRKDHHGTVESESYPIQMERVGNVPILQVPPVKG